MLLSNSRFTVRLSAARVFKDCIKDKVSVDSELYSWWPSIECLEVKEEDGNASTTIRFYNEDESLDLGETGVEWSIIDYIDRFAQ